LQLYIEFNYAHKYVIAYFKENFSFGYLYLLYYVQEKPKKISFLGLIVKFYKKSIDTYFVQSSSN